MEWVNEFEENVAKSIEKQHFCIEESEVKVNEIGLHLKLILTACIFYNWSWGLKIKRTCMYFLDLVLEVYLTQACFKLF